MPTVHFSDKHDIITVTKVVYDDADPKDADWRPQTNQKKRKLSEITKKSPAYVQAVKNLSIPPTTLRSAFRIPPSTLKSALEKTEDTTTYTFPENKYRTLTRLYRVLRDMCVYTHRAIVYSEQLGDFEGADYYQDFFEAKMDEKMLVFEQIVRIEDEWADRWPKDYESDSESGSDYDSDASVIV